MEGGRFRWRRRCSAGGGDIANVPSPTAPTSCGAHSRRIDNLALSSPGPATEPFDSLIKSTYMGVDRASGCNPLLAYATDPSTRPTRQPTAGDKKEAETRKKSKQLSRYANVLLSAGGWGGLRFFLLGGFFLHRISPILGRPAGVVRERALHLVVLTWIKWRYRMSLSSFRRWRWSCCKNKPK